MKIERTGSLIELAAAVVQMNPLAGLDWPHGNSDHDAELGDRLAFRDGDERDLVAHGDFVASDEFALSCRADDGESRAGGRFAEERSDVVGGLDLEGRRCGFAGHCSTNEY